MTRPKIYDMELVREKLTRAACRAELRLVVYAPVSVPPGLVRSQLERLVTAYRRFNLAAANGFVARPLTELGRAHAAPGRRSRRRAGTWRSSTPRELAGLWHLPQAQADVRSRADPARRGAAARPVAHGCRIGRLRPPGALGTSRAPP